jgi:hypothetical protein
MLKLLNNNFIIINMTTSLTRTKTSNPLILIAANAYLRKKLNAQVIPIKDYNVTDSEFSRPKLLHFLQQKDEKNRLLSEVKNLIHDDISPNNILLVTTSNLTKKSLKLLIESTLDVPCSCLDNENIQRSADHIAICTLAFLHEYNLSAPYIFISDIHLQAAGEKQFHDDIEKEQNLIMKNARQLTIAMSRAQQELTLLITSDKVPPEFLSPHFHIPNNESDVKADVRYLHA